MNILIVDDNNDNRMTIELLLEEFGSILITNAVNGEEAVQECRNTRFDLIFMDIMMPVMNGIEATREIKSFSKDSMVIALSALDDYKSKQAMLQNGAEDYMTKPIESELFIQRVKNYINIIQMRSSGANSTQGFMLFKEKVYPSSVKFQVNSENDLAYFWNYYLNDLDTKANQISDAVRMIYGFGLWMLKNKKSFQIVAEENDEQLFLTQSNIEVVSEIVIKNILLKHCPEMIYIVDDNSVSFRLNKNISLISEVKADSEDETQKYKKAILSKTHFDKLDAQTYVSETAVTYMNKIESLEMVEDKLDNALIVFEKEPTNITILDVSKVLLDYVAILDLLVEFEHIGFALSTMSKFIIEIDETLFDSSNVKKFVTMNLHLLADLRDWRENIFIKQDANDIHYLDSSLLSSCLQIESIFSSESVEDSDDDLEFF